MFPERSRAASAATSPSYRAPKAASSMSHSRLPVRNLMEAAPPVSSRKIRLYLVDDHALFREGLLRLLSNDSEFELTGATGDVDQAIADISASPPDILILD